MFPVISIGNYSWPEFINSIHPVKQPEAIETLNIIERRHIGLIEQDLTFDIFTVKGLDRRAGRFQKWCSDNSDYTGGNLQFGIFLQRHSSSSKNSLA
jgi:hypothetical protein